MSVINTLIDVVVSLLDDVLDLNYRYYRRNH